jgi:predicted nuclease of predicted toxin-antitoxin system
MKFLVDQNFPRTCSTVLAEFGHTLCEYRYSPGISENDSRIFEAAQKLGAVFLTTDKDFFHTIPWLFPAHFGVVVITLTKPNREALLEKLRWALNFLTTHVIKDHVLLLRDHRAIYSERKK